MSVEEAFYRRERARLLGALTRVFGPQHLPLLEDVVQETLARAFEVWSYQERPAHWPAQLMVAAKNRALDVFRRERTARKFEPEIERAIEGEVATVPQVDALFLPPALRDDELRLMFSVCHPQLAEDAQVALLLNVCCAFTAVEIACVYLASSAAIQKRIARGKKVLASSSRLFELSANDFAPRLRAVLRALYVLFSEGYHGAGETVIREELCREALRLARLLVEHGPAATEETCALTALLCLLTARLRGRTNEIGELLALRDQDRARWDMTLAGEGLRLLERAAKGAVLSSYHIEAAIAGLHVSAPTFEETRWDEIVRMYDLQMRVAPSPIVALNRAIALAELEGPESGLRAIAAIDDVERLRRYPFHAAARGELEWRRGKLVAARTHFERAFSLARNEGERSFLRRRLASCSE